jgi:hypothetical protein
MSDFNEIGRELIGTITQHIELPAFVTLTSSEARFLFGNHECYNDNTEKLNYVYVDNNKGKFKVVCSKTDQELDF